MRMLHEKGMYNETKTAIRTEKTTYGGKLFIRITCWIYVTIRVSQKQPGRSVR